MINITDNSKCSGCHACYNSCPTHCITMKADEEGFLYPSVNYDLCVNCGECEKVCPFSDTEKRKEPIGAWAAKCSDEQLCFESSSGGVFSLLARKTVEAGGIIFGAAFSEDFREVCHIAVDNVDNLIRLRTSKYVQSTVGDSYRAAKACLDAGKPVLFSGTPCQIAGLKNYLGKEYDDLLCVDVVCHGVPSPKLWGKYLNSIAEKYQGSIVNVNFRHKKADRQRFGISRTSDGLEIFVSKSTDPYMQMFLKNYSLRPSCYQCITKETGSAADITLGDFWGIHKVLPEMNDGKGTSLVIVHNAKGQQLLNDISDQVDAKRVTYDTAVKYNSSIYQSAAKPAEREAFFFDMNSLSFDDFLQKYSRPQNTSIRQSLSDTALWKKLRPLIRGEAADKLEYGLLVSIRKN